MALMASSPGRLGGVHVIPRLRDAVCELGMVPVPGFASVGNAAQAFSENGDLGDEQLAQDGAGAVTTHLISRVAGIARKVLDQMLVAIAGLADGIKAVALVFVAV